MNNLYNVDIDNKIDRVWGPLLRQIVIYIMLFQEKKVSNLREKKISFLVGLTST